MLSLLTFIVGLEIKPYTAFGLIKKKRNANSQENS